MKILVVCNAETHWTYGFVKEVLLKRKDSISLLSLSNIKYKEWYRQNDIDVITVRNEAKLLDNIKYIRTLTAVLKMGKFIMRSDADVILVIYPSWLVNILLNNSKVKSRIIYYYIGSDLMRTPIFELRLGRRAVFESKGVVFVTAEMEECFIKAFGNGYKGSMHIIDFGITNLDYIDSNEESTEQCKSNYLCEDEKDKVIVSVGYNASSAQQADLVLEQFKSLPIHIKRKIKVIVPMQYGYATEEYSRKVESELSEAGFASIILRDYYDGKQMATFNKAVDVFINAQITDAQSAAVIEHLYSGTVMLNPKWLKYDYLEKIGLFYLRYNAFEEINGIFEDVVENIEKYKKMASDNHGKMSGKFTWKKCKEEWDEVLSDYDRECGDKEFRKN